MDTLPDAGGAPAAPPGAWQHVELPFRPPLALEPLIEFLTLRAVPGVEAMVDGVYQRVMRLPGGPGIVTVHPGPTPRDDPATENSRLPGDDRSTENSRRSPGDDRSTGHPCGRPTVSCRMRLTDPSDAPLVVSACRRLLGLDADPAAVDAALSADPLLAPLVAARPGRRVPVHVDPAELAVRAVLGQQVTLAAARGLAGRLVELCGEPVDAGRPGSPLTTAFPSPDAIAEADLDRLGMPGARRATLRALARALAGGDIVLDPDGDHDEVEHRLLALPGIGPWTASYVRMRALGDPDVFLAGDAGVRNALAALGVSGPPPDERWRPWRSYAVQHLWASLG